MKNLLIIQFPETPNFNLDQLIELEDFLEGKLAPAEIDGHDCGSGQMNIFILTNAPLETFRVLKDLLSHKPELLSKAKIAYRGIDQESFIPLWPTDLKEFLIL